MPQGVFTAATAQNPETLFDNKCGICHVKTKPADMSSLMAVVAKR